MLSRFVGEPITVEFDRPPLYAKLPPCPARFIWAEEAFEVVENLREWRDYGRRGRMANNMRPENLKKAAKRGSWGVGRYYFRVQVANSLPPRRSGSRIFEIYYDRAPKGRTQRLGSWFLNREILADSA
ncbi:hypothetical protein MNBD_CHLOROFLEXI01-4278 [hydrothermal vent metagenome]|uniref:DUF6504 domain-containing protein n=1 Tax=hydrothermal vent metagenome TaxID=652676 RepID=A0A3B0VTX1_9ZZZZ